jgi:hypothetical protein
VFEISKQSEATNFSEPDLAEVYVDLSCCESKPSLELKLLLILPKLILSRRKGEELLSLSSVALFTFTSNPFKGSFIVLMGVKVYFLSPKFLDLDGLIPTLAERGTRLGVSDEKLALFESTVFGCFT